MKTLFAFTDGPIGAAPVTYLQSPVPQVQRSVYVGGNDMYQYAPNPHTYIQPSVPLYSNETSLLQLTRPYQPFVQHPYVQYCGLAAGRGTKDKDKEDSDLKSGCVSRGIFTENIDNLKVPFAKFINQIRSIGIISLLLGEFLYFCVIKRVG